VPPAAVDVTLCENNGIACFCRCFAKAESGTQVQRQSHCFGFTRLQVNLLEAFQFLDRPINGRILLADVELSYLSTGAFDPKNPLPCVGWRS